MAFRPSPLVIRDKVAHVRHSSFSEYGVLRMLLVLGLLVASMISPVAAQSDHETLWKLKSDDWPRAYRTQDTALLNSILAEEFERVGSDGAWSNKKQELAWISANKPSYDSLVFQVTRLDVFENGTAIVAGTGRIYSHRGEQSQVEEYQSTNVLIKRRGTWKAVASHTSGDRIRPST